ncbi:MAG: serine hydrolase domain-containing protein [Actinomycetota bacterium]
MADARTAAVADVAGKLTERVAAFVKKERLPGAAAGIVVDDALAWSTGYGYADVEARRPHDAQTVFRIASITKTFTATAIMQLRDEGTLHLDDPAVAFLPELRDATSSFGMIETVTLRRMLSHESGLMGDPPGARWFHDIYEASPAANLAKAADIATKIPPNLQQKYSNLAFQLLGEIVARLDARPYPDAIRARILEPLGMTSSGFHPLPPELMARRAVGYKPRWLSDTFEPFSPTLTEFPLAEGGLQSSVEDVARWLSAQFPMEKAAEGHRTVLSDATLREMQRPRYLEGDKWEEAWAIGWYAVRKGETVWLQHSGGLPGFITNACFRPKERIGAIAFLNGVADASALAMELGAIALEAVNGAVVAYELPDAMPDAYAPLLGVYGEPVEALLMRLEWRDGKLVLRDPDEPDQTLTLLPTDDPMRFSVDWFARESGEPVEFHAGADGRITGVTIGPYSLQRFEPMGEPAVS